MPDWLAGRHQVVLWQVAPGKADVRLQFLNIVMRESSKPALQARPTPHIIPWWTSMASAPPSHFFLSPPASPGSTFCRLVAEVVLTFQTVLHQENGPPGHSHHLHGSLNLHSGTEQIHNSRSLRYLRCCCFFNVFKQELILKLRS